MKSDRGGEGASCTHGYWLHNATHHATHERTMAVCVCVPAFARVCFKTSAQNSLFSL